MLLNYYLFSTPNRHGEYPIRISAIIMRTRLMTTIGISVSKYKWNACKQMVRSGYANHKGQTSEEINDRLLEIAEKLRQYEKNINGKPDVCEMRAVIVGKAASVRESSEAHISAVGWLDVFITEEAFANQWTKGTVGSFISMRKHIDAHCGSAPLDYFDDGGVTAFLNYLRHDCKMMESTIRKEYKCLKWFLGWAVRKRLISSDKVFQIKPKIKVLEQPVVYLSKEELLRLYSYKFPENDSAVVLHDYLGRPYTRMIRRPADLAVVRDMFCFCAFTSLRYSDMIKLKDTDIIEDVMYITTAKTNDRLPINLNSFSREILDRYRNVKTWHEYLFPRVSIVEMNRKLKEICELVEINTPLTKVYVKGGRRVEETKPKYMYVGTHAGRRTFICFALSSGVPPQIVMKWTGHSDYSAMRPYIDIAERSKEESMLFIEKKLKE